MAREKGYCWRWMVETAFSSFKRLFCEESMVTTMENIARKLVAKVRPIQHVKKTTLT